MPMDRSTESENYFEATNANVMHEKDLLHVDHYICCPGRSRRKAPMMSQDQQ